MDFGLSEEQELLQETVRGFVRGECPAPRLREIYDAGGFEPGALEGPRGARLRGPRAARGARRRGARAARVRARRRGARRRRASRARSSATRSPASRFALGGQRRAAAPLAAGARVAARRSATVAFGERGERWLPGELERAPRGRPPLAARRPSCPAARARACSWSAPRAAASRSSRRARAGLRCEADRRPRPHARRIAHARTSTDAPAEALPGGARRGRPRRRRRPRAARRRRLRRRLAHDRADPRLRARRASSSASPSRSSRR